MPGRRRTARPLRPQPCPRRTPPRPVPTPAACRRVQGQGLSPKQMAQCDAFVYIPQHGAGTASLNVTVAASIVLHHFALWAGLPEAPRQGAKYCVEALPPRNRPRGTVRHHAQLGACRAAAGVRAAGCVAEALLSLQLLRLSRLLRLLPLRQWGVKLVH